MSTIRVVWGGASGPTATAAYDAALAAAGIHDYNLVTVSSVVPADATIEVVGTAPDLGPAGHRLSVVQGRATMGPADDGPAVAGIGWKRGPDGRGIFYEDSGRDPSAVRARIDRGLEHGVSLRSWEPADEGAVVRETPAESGDHTVQTVCAVYGDGTRIL